MPPFGGGGTVYPPLPAIPPFSSLLGLALDVPARCEVSPPGEPTAVGLLPHADAATVVTTTATIAKCLPDILIAPLSEVEVRPK